MPRAGTRSASSDEPAWAVPDSLRPTLARPFGPVYSGSEADRRIRVLEGFGSCGDVVTARAIELGNLPLIALVDYKTRREQSVAAEVFRPLAERRRVRVRNPAGFLTERLLLAVRELLDAGGGLVEVDGEEDLGALALIEALPAGATVIYGIPGAGVSFVPVDTESKERVRHLIEQMELRSIDLGD